VLGANIFNMGIATAFLAALVFVSIVRIFGNGRRTTLAAAFSAAWLSVMLAAALTSAQLALSGTSPWGVVLPAMMGVHALIGIGEGLITAAAVALVLSARPDLVRLGEFAGRRARGLAVEGSAVS
jgi:cobalt/nickel transport system permease protein